jgi:lipopolysaccharide export system permease protein
VVGVNIFTRYILRAHVAPAVAGLAIFYFVLSMDFIVDYLDLFIARGVPGLAVLEAFGLSLAWMTLLAVPMAVMVAVLTAFGRLSQDNEITAAKANGVPVFSLIAPVLIVSALAACGLFYFGNHAVPGANHRLKTLLVSIHRMRPLATIQPGVLTELPGDYTIIVDRIDPRTSEIFRIRIYRLESGEPVQTVVAARGRVMSAADSDILTIELYDGEIHNIDREDPTRYNRLVFERHIINVQGGSAELIRAEDTKRGDRELSLAEIKTRIAADDADLVSARRRVASALDRRLATLLDEADVRRPAASPAAVGRGGAEAGHAAEVALRALDAQIAKTRKLRVEYHKKLSIPFACIVFVLLGAPIGIRTRRGGVGIGAGIGMLFFLIYYLFLIGGEQLGDRGFVSPFWAMWAPNVLFGGIGLFLTLATAREWRVRSVGSVMRLLLRTPAAACAGPGRRA